MIALLILAALLDAATMLLLPQGSELNPFAATFPLIAIAVKLLVVVYVIALRHVRYFRGVVAFGTVLWSVGAASNLMVIL